MNMLQGMILPVIKTIVRGFAMAFKAPDSFKTNNVKVTNAVSDSSDSQCKFCAWMAIIYILHMLQKACCGDNGVKL